MEVSFYTRTCDVRNGARSAAQPAPQSPYHPLSTLGASDPPQRAECGHTVAFSCRTPKHLCDADLLLRLLQDNARAHLGLQEHGAYLHGQREPRV